MLYNLFGKFSIFPLPVVAVWESYFLLLPQQFMFVLAIRNLCSDNMQLDHATASHVSCTLHMAPWCTQHSVCPNHLGIILNVLLSICWDYLGSSSVGQTNLHIRTTRATDGNLLAELQLQIKQMPQFCQGFKDGAILHRLPRTSTGPQMV